MSPAASPGGLPTSGKSPGCKVENGALVFARALFYVIDGVHALVGNADNIDAFI